MFTSSKSSWPLLPRSFPSVIFDKLFRRIFSENDVVAGNVSAEAKLYARWLAQSYDGLHCPFVDRSVYSSSRCFRLVGNAKFGDGHALIPVTSGEAGFVTRGVRFSDVIPTLQKVQIRISKQILCKNLTSFTI